MKPGDRVITCTSVFCGTCEYCVTGRPQLCNNADVKMPPGKARRLFWQGKPVVQFANLSSFAEQLYQRPYPVSDVAQVRLVSDAMRSGICISLFHASQHASMMASYPSQTELQRKLPRMNSQTFSMGFSSGA